MALPALGILIMPVSVFFLMRKDRGPARTLLDAGAVSEDTSRRPVSLGIERLVRLRDDEKRGVIVGVGDGRYFVNVARYRTVRRRRQVIGLVFAAVMTAVAVLVGLAMMPPA